MGIQGPAKIPFDIINDLPKILRMRRSTLIAHHHSQTENPQHLQGRKFVPLLLRDWRFDCGQQGVPSAEVS